MCDASEKSEFICCLCNKVLLDYNNFNSHVRKKHNIKLREYWLIYSERNPCKISESASKLICRLCGREFKDYHILGNHISIVHNLNTKEYYDKFFKKEIEGKCQECNKETSYEGLNIGYLKFCSLKCSNNNVDIQNKKKYTCFKNYGVENPSQSYIVREKQKETCFKNHNANFPQQCKEVREKTKQNNLLKYGVEFVSQDKEIKERTRQSNIIKFGCNYSLQNKEVQNKSSDTMFKKYGVKNASQSSVIKEKKKDTCFKNYGVEYPCQSPILYEKQKQTCLKNHGVEFYSQSKEHKKDMEERGFFKTKEERTKYEEYRRCVRVETNKHIKELDKNWDGLCFYNQIPLYEEKEYKQLFVNQPINFNKIKSIDHKYSVSYCFKNNISPEICGTLNNLCYVSLSVNSEKNNKTEEEYRQWLKENHKQR